MPIKVQMFRCNCHGRCFDSFDSAAACERITESREATKIIVRARTQEQRRIWDANYADGLKRWRAGATAVEVAREFKRTPTSIRWWIYRALRDQYPTFGTRLFRIGLNKKLRATLARLERWEGRKNV